MRFAISGRLDPLTRTSHLAEHVRGAQLQPRHSAQLGLARSGAPTIEIEVQPDDIVELELADGLRLWVRAEDVEQDFGLKPSRNGGPIALPTVLPVAGRSRGVGEWVIKGLKVFGIDIAGTITDYVSANVEARLQPGPGLYRCTEGSPTSWVPVTGPLSGVGPTLVFLHGTASSTEGSFGGLWAGGDKARIRDLIRFYEGRVLALQHRTLTESPIQNAVALAATLERALPAQAEIHLVSHSRGGLVGELLARGMRIDRAPFDARDLALFADTHAHDRKSLQDLDAVLTRSGLRVTRFVRVACPARGTTLADGRLDRYFSFVTNVLGKVTGLQASPVYDGVTSLLAAVLKKRTEPSELPGLEAMMPGSALVLMLNRPDVQTRADLHVLGGDLEGEGVWGRLKTLGTDLFYRDDHDLVVNTPSMFGGITRDTGKIRYWIDEGTDVTHFNYFHRADTATRLVSALTSAAPAKDFRELERRPFEVTSSDYRKRSAEPRPVVFVLPGIMGSTLTASGQPVWLDYVRLATGGLRDLALGAPNVVASGLVPSGYEKLLRHLSLTHEVVPFPYDWRDPIDQTAHILRQEIDRKLAETKASGQPIRVLAHSMGGLVFRAMLASEEGIKTWRRMCEHPAARFIMLGTPNGGSHAIAAMLIGRDSLTRKLALLDLSSNYAELLQVITDFDGVLNLLPHQGTLDLYESPTWDTLFAEDVPSNRGLFSSSVASTKSAGFAWMVPAVGKLREAKRIRDLLRASPIDPARMIYVAGCADETACDLRIDTAAKPGRRVVVVATERGDGRVPWTTGIPAELASRTYYMNEVHGDLASAEDHFPALDDLLINGVTTKLATTPPARRTRIDETFPLRVPLPSMIPDEQDLVDDALGGSTRRSRRRKERPRVKVRIAHGDLSGAASAVVVGHYQGDALVNAEAYLDLQLDGRLSELQRMDLYPGAIGTALASLNTPEDGRGRHPGAIVVGLGMVGDLTPGKLTAALTQGLTTYGAERVGLERRRRQRGAVDARQVIETPVTMLLIGSGEGGVTLSDSLQSILRAVEQANDRLALRAQSSEESMQARGSAPLTAFIDRVDILELYEDRAIQAVVTLNRLARSQHVQRTFVVDELLVHGRDGRSTEIFEERSGWWQRVRISSESAPGQDGASVPERCKGRGFGALKFETIGGRARADSALLGTQRRIVDRFLARATQTTAVDRDLAYTLFELLIPPGFKEASPDRRKLQLLLDEESARYPWELLQDRHDRGARPLSVETAMIRQLLLPPSESRAVRSLGDCALVVGNPIVDDRRFPTLPGAKDEADEVERVLTSSGVQVVKLVEADATPEAVLYRLYERPWQILHFAAHGVVDFVEDECGRPVTGVVLGDGIFLTPNEIAAVRPLPDLVFINCCHLGATDNDASRAPTEYHRLAANVATQFIRMGVRAVVAAGWAVDDAAAKDFASTFYASMLAGLTFGEAVLRARQAVYDAHGATNTWGAYQCYGDHSFSLRAGAADASDERPVAPSDASRRFQNIARAARSRGDQNALKERLDLLLNLCPPGWLQDAVLCADVGDAYRELEQFDRAIEFYERGCLVELGVFPLRSAEHLANLLARSLDAAADPGAVKASRERAEAILNALLVLGATAERQSLVGSLHKRLAQLARSNPSEALKHVQLMSGAYSAAYDLATARNGKDPWYPLLNLIAAEIVLPWIGGATSQNLAQHLAALARFADTATSAADFWSAVLAADHALLDLLASDVLDGDRWARIVEQYRVAVRRASSARELNSVINQIRFFAAMADLAGTHQGRATWLAALIEDIETLRDQL